VSNNLIELFVLKNAAISTEVSDVLTKLEIVTKKSEIEVATDRLVEDYIRQIDYTIRASADRMSEFYKIFYMLENDIRLLVESTLEDSKGESGKGPIAHCGILSEDEVVRLKLTVRDWYKLME
jgi:hypothetical protein